MIESRCTRHDLQPAFILQDTVIALQALAYYAAFSGASAIDLRLNISVPASSFVSGFQINSTNYRMYQSQEVMDDCMWVESEACFLMHILIDILNGAVFTV